MKQTPSVNRERLLANFLDLLAINSTSRHEAPMARKVTSLLLELDAE